MTYALNILHFEVDQTVIVVGPKSHFVMTQNHAYLSQLCLNLRIEVNFHALRFRPKWDIAHLGLKYDFGPSKVGQNPFKYDVQCRFTYLVLGPKISFSNPCLLSYYASNLALKMPFFVFLHT